ncbi:MAG: 16S rRNA (cytidine(1402)-2'-O)-methyltransferase [Proteobacteria bacterium]|nr:16S rRNA (cytidine(1402)-2'-O)-methyltransferase [Pseudomonadota bacterium]MBU1611383.1 16S rRNA (cytidine(1402)-2'-O)-methyltransferase [Pseudomonadota bacterium]
MPGRLHIVATPLGNTGDCSPRAREILASADVVLAEDTRRAGALFTRLGIARKDGAGFISFHDHNEAERIPRILTGLAEGDQVAVISDAGTPLISDPGYRLVAACREQGFEVTPIPGPSAITAALSAAGLPPLPFTFLGFLPRKSGQISRLLATHKETGCTLIFFERKSRLSETLALANEILGSRPICIARELTKDFEEFITGNLGALQEMQLDLKGEITVIIGPPEAGGVSSEAEVLEVLGEEREAGGKPKEIAHRATARLRGFTAKMVYEMMRHS